jgi:hypothetical protein
MRIVVEVPWSVRGDEVRRDEPGGYGLLRYLEEHSSFSFTTIQIDVSIDYKLLLGCTTRELIMTVQLFRKLEVIQVRRLRNSSSL